MLYQPYYTVFHPIPSYRYRRQYSPSDGASARVRALGLGKSPGAHLVEKFTIRDKNEGVIRGNGTGTGRTARFINTSRDTSGGEVGSVVVGGCFEKRECRESEDGTGRGDATRSLTQEGSVGNVSPEKQGAKQSKPDDIGVSSQEKKIHTVENEPLDEIKIKEDEVNPRTSTKEKPQSQTTEDKPQDNPKEDPSSLIEPIGLQGKPEENLHEAKVKKKVLTSKKDNEAKPEDKGLTIEQDKALNTELSKAKGEGRGSSDKHEDNREKRLPKSIGDGLKDKTEHKVKTNVLKDKLKYKGSSDKPEDKAKLCVSRVKLEDKGSTDVSKIDKIKLGNKQKQGERPEEWPKPDLPERKENQGSTDKRVEREGKEPETDTLRIKEGQKGFSVQRDKAKTYLPETKFGPKGLADKPEDKRDDKLKPDVLQVKALPDKPEVKIVGKPKQDLPNVNLGLKGLLGKPEDKTQFEQKGISDNPEDKKEDKPKSVIPKVRGLQDKTDDNKENKSSIKGLASHHEDKKEDKPKSDLPKTKLGTKILAGKPEEKIEDKPKQLLTKAISAPKGLDKRKIYLPKDKQAKGLTDKPENKKEDSAKPDLRNFKSEHIGILDKPDSPKAKEDERLPDKLDDFPKTKLGPKGIADNSENKLKPGLAKTISGLKPETNSKPDLPKNLKEAKGLADKPEDKEEYKPKIKIGLKGLSEKIEGKSKEESKKLPVKTEDEVTVEPKGLAGQTEDKPKQSEAKIGHIKQKEGPKRLLDKPEDKSKTGLPATKKKPVSGLFQKEEEVGSVSDKENRGHLGGGELRSNLFKCTTQEDLSDPSKYDSDANNNDWEEVEVEEFDMEAKAVVKKKKVIVKKTGTQVKVTPLEAKPPKGGEMEVSIPGELTRQISKKRLSLVDEDLCYLVERKTSITDDIIVQEAAYLDSMIRVEMLDRRKSSLGFPAIPEEVKEVKKDPVPVQDDRRAAWKKKTIKQSVKTLGGFYKPQIQEDSSSSEEEECDVNCHRKCQLLMPNLCGVNQKLMAEALSRLQLKGRASTSEQNANSSECSDSSESTAAGRVSPPAKTLPRFRSYSINDFQFLKVLGKGSFGKVLLAELKGSECYYAVKCLKKDVVLEDDDVECTLIERKVLALATGHPYFSHLFCTFQTESHLFFVMEYLNGGDLMFHIQQSGRFDEGRARFYAAEIVSGLSFLHKWGIVYRDLKLDNVLLDFDGHVRIADFGMCKLQIYLDKTTDTFCGTPDYMAPEVIKGLKYNQCVDWWSFGILLYEMLVGQSPFSGCDEDDLFWSICNTRPHMPSYLSAPAKSILLDLMQKNWTKRLGSSENGAADVMNHAFFDGFKWHLLERKLLDPPFKPTMKHPLDTKYFDKVFTSEKPVLTPVDKTILESMDQTQFQGFSYTNPNATE